MPYLSRIEGLLVILRSEYKEEYINMAITEIHSIKARIKEVIKDFE